MRFLVSLAGLVALTAIIPLCVEGQQDPWGQWTSCSQTCGGGLRTRKTQCRHPQNKCPSENEACNSQACSVNGSSAVNVTIAPSEAKNGTVQPPRPSAALNAKSGAPQPSDTVGPTSNEGIVTTDAAVSTKTLKDDEIVEYIGTATMDKTWSDELANPASQQHRELKKTVETPLKETFEKEEGILAAEVKEFSPGSVVVHFRVKTLRSREVPRSRLESVFGKSIQSGPMKDLNIKYFKLSSMVQLAAGGSNNHLGDEGNTFKDPWKYFLYGFGVMIVLAITFVLLGVIKMKLVSKFQGQLKEGSPEFERKFSLPGKERQPELEDQDKNEKENNDDFKAFHH